MATTAHTSPNTDNSERYDMTSKMAILKDAVKKEKRNLARALRIVTCLAYLAVTLQLLYSGLSNTKHVMKPHVQEAQIMLRTQANEIYRQKILAERVVTLRTKQLGKVSFESHVACLARGIKTANQQLLRIGFQYPEIRQQAIEWTEENCARLLFVPQTKSRPTRQQLILDFWTEVGHRYREYSAYAVTTMKQMVNYVWKGIPNVYGRQDQPTLKTTRSIVKQSFKINFDPSTGTKLPTGITIKCRNTTVCHVNSKNAPTVSSTTSAKEVAESAKRVSLLLEIMDDLSNLGSIINKLKAIIACMTLFITGYSVSRCFQFRDRTKSLFKNSWLFHGCVSNEEYYLFCLNLMQVLVRVIGELIQSRHGFSSNLNLAFGLFFLATGIKMLVFDFLNPWSSRPNISKCIGEMYRFAFDKDDAPSAQEASDDAASEETSTASANSPSSTSSDDSQADVNPAVEITDVDTESDVESNVFTEYDSDSDDGFVDLAA